MYKNSGRDKMCKKTFAKASKFANFSSADDSRYTVFLNQAYTAEGHAPDS